METCVIALELSRKSSKVFFWSTSATFTTSGHTKCTHPSLGTICISYNQISRSLLSTTHLLSSIQVSCEPNDKVLNNLLAALQGIRYRGKHCDPVNWGRKPPLFLPFNNNRRFILPYMKSPRLLYAKSSGIPLCKASSEYTRLLPRGC